MSAEVEEEDFLSTGFEPDLPGQQQQHHHEESFDSIFGDQPRANQSDELPLIENLPHSNFNPGGTNDVYTVFLIVNAALGAGLLNLPKAFDAAGGVVAAILVQLVLIVFIVVALYILAYAADRNSASPATTIQDVMGQSIGGVGRLITSVCVVIYCFGTTVTFLIVIGDQFDLVLESLVGPNFCNKFYMNRDFTMSMTAIVFILPFCFSRRIDFLRIPSLLGVFAIIYLVALIVYEYYFGNFTAGPIKHWPTRWTDVFLVVPDICFGYQCHVSVIPIYSCMKHRNLKHFGVVSVSAIVVCAFCYTGAAAFGYLTFGSNVNPDILMSYSADRPEVLIGILAMALKTVSTYPILLFCGREAVGSAITDLKALLSTAPSDSSSSSITTDRVSDIPEDQPQNGHFSSPVRIRIIIVVIWFLLSLMCAVVVPNIGEAIGLLGTLAAVFIFIIPGLCLANITFRSDPSLMRKFNIFLLVTGGVFIVIGTFLFGVVLTQDIQTMVKSPTSGLIRYYFHLNKLTCDMSS